MRQARPGSTWTAGRVQRRRDYDRYMASPAWAATRAAWHREERQRAGKPVSCKACGSEDDLELHHLDYDRLGQERHEDLVALCDVHHRHLHDVYDASYVWRKLGRRAASLGIIDTMRG